MPNTVGVHQPNHRPSPRQRELPMGRIARALGETAPGPRAQIAQIVQVFGLATALRLLEKVRDVEAHGGLLVRNGSRRRTPGGTFFHLARSWCRGTEERRIFGHASASSEAAVVKGDMPTSRAPHSPPLSLPEALALFTPDLRKGDATVKLTLVGQPGSVVDCKTYVAFELTSSLPGNLPKGLPAVPQTTITWVALVTAKQWKPVAASLADTPETKVIIEGYPVASETKHFVMASSCTTTALQQANRAAVAGKEPFRA
jgi:hypothetical protein